MESPTHSRAELVIVIPAYNAAAFLKRSLPVTLAIADEVPVLIVDAGSSDSTTDLALSLGARVLRLPERAGPALARNAGALEMDADVILFMDADCVPHKDVVKRVRDAFRADPDLVSLTGSYDASPPEPGFFSQYMNLRHHYTHQRARREGATFWAGCGAVRREAFLDVGGFDADRFPRPAIEDIALALQLCRRGRLGLDPNLQVTHLKRWTLRGVIETDIRRRAIPWTKLILETGRTPDDLNLRWSQRLAAALAPFALLALPTAVWIAWSGQWLALVVPSAVLGASLALNAPMVRCFARQRGIPFAAGAWLFHQIHLLYSGATFAIVTAWSLCRRVLSYLAPRRYNGGRRRGS